MLALKPSNGIGGGRSGSSWRMAIVGWLWAGVAAREIFNPMMYPWVHSAEVLAKYICSRSEPLLKFSRTEHPPTPFYNDNEGISSHRNPCRTAPPYLLFLRYGGGHAVLGLPIGDNRSTGFPRPTSPQKRATENRDCSAGDTPLRVGGKKVGSRK